MLWSLWLAMMPERDLITLVERNAETHDAVRMAYLMLGVTHGTISSRGLRWKVALASFGLGFGAVVNSAVLCSRLGDACLVWLPVLNVCLPFAAGFGIVLAIGADSADGQAKIRSLQAQLSDAQRRSIELEQARRASLLAAAEKEAQKPRFWEQVSCPNDFEKNIVVYVKSARRRR